MVARLHYQFKASLSVDILPCSTPNVRREYSPDTVVPNPAAGQSGPCPGGRGLRKDHSPRVAIPDFVQHPGRESHGSGGAGGASAGGV